MTFDTKPTITERLSSASNTSDLSVTVERPGDAYTLIAAGKTPRVIGRYLIALYGEWDAGTKPRRVLDHDVDAVARLLPSPPKALVYAPKILDRWAQHEAADRLQRARVVLATSRSEAARHAFARLKSLPKVESGLADMLAGKVKDPAHRVRDVLLWWLDSMCAACNGTRYELAPGTLKQSDRACGRCHGSGERPLPHGADGRVIERRIEDCLARARVDIGHGRKNILRHLR